MERCQIRAGKAGFPDCLDSFEGALELWGTESLQCWGVIDVGDKRLGSSAMGATGQSCAALAAVELEPSGRFALAVAGEAMGPRASAGGLLSHSQVSSLRLQLEELDGWCRISLAGFSLLSEVVV